MTDGCEYGPILNNCKKESTHTYRMFVVKANIPLCEEHSKIFAHYIKDFDWKGTLDNLTESG